MDTRMTIYNGVEVESISDHKGELSASIEIEACLSRIDSGERLTIKIESLSYRSHEYIDRLRDLAGIFCVR